MVLDDLGRHQEALCAIDKAAELNPDDLDAWYNIAIALRKLGHYEDALLAIEKAFELNPNDYDWWRKNKGMA
jgi:tetratricopeptide (TPR) repeat protein